MLSTNSTSSIEKRRQQHRRQQSLAVPILAPHHPAHARRNQPARNAHRRGLSLDQSLTAMNSSVGPRQFHSQDGHQDQDQDQDQQRPGSSPVRIHLDTNTGHNTDQQHFLQETQQQSLAQPGFQAQDFQKHLQQQLHDNAPPHIATPSPDQPSRQQALQQLQHHVEWYNKNFGSPAEQSMPFGVGDAGNTTGATFANSASLPQSQQQMQQAIQHGHGPQAVTPVSQGHGRTVPNTPQRFNTQGWPSPPPTNPKHIRSQSYQNDVVQMPPAAVGRVLIDTASSPAYIASMGGFAEDNFTLASEHGYASSNYTASIADPMSPGRHINATALPTLFEESMGAAMGMQHAGMTQDQLLLHAAASASDDFNSPNFIMGGGNLGLSPQEALLESLGPNVNASIVETGVPMDEIDRHISEQHPVSKLFFCLWMDDGVQCDKWHKRKENARSHVQGHLGDRQFLCNDCGKTFVRQHDMKRHAAIHNPERPHRCPCGSRFARHDALTRHRQRGMCKGALPGFERSEEDKPKRGRPKKKDRPDHDTRNSKAQRARQMDRENADSAVGAYNSSSSVASERSLPMTPPDTSDFDADAFISMAGGAELQFNTVPASWNDTPPTSPMPLSASTSKTIDRCDFAAQGISPAVLSQGSNHSTPTASATHSPRVTCAHPSPAASTSGATASFHGASSPLDAYSHEMSVEDDDFNFNAVDAHPDAAGTQDFFSDAFSPPESTGDGSEDFNHHGSADGLSFEDHDDEDTTAGSYMRSSKGAGSGSFDSVFSLRDSLFDEREHDFSMYTALDHFIATH